MGNDDGVHILLVFVFVLYLFYFIIIIINYYFGAKGDFINAWGQDPWAKR